MAEVYCFTPRLKRTETTRGPGKMHFQILIRSSEGSFSKIVKERGESMIKVMLNRCT